MKFNRRSDLKDRHAFLSPSGYSWINYSKDKLISVYMNSMAKERGTRLHHIAQELIDERIKLPKTGATLNMYVNDAIGFRMETEVPLWYSEFCFGTADAICFNEKKNLLRIHDLKTGEIKAHMEQLDIYEALFCLQYGYKPDELQAELRIYQNNDIIVENPDPALIEQFMHTIIEWDKVLKQIQMEGA